MSRSKVSIIFFLFLAGCLGLSAQSTTLQVVTKKIEKTFPYKKNYEVNIEGEKAEVVIESWSKNEIKVEMDLIAKHPTKKQAEKDIQFIKHQAELEKNKIYLRNYISVPEGKNKPESSLSARYTITVPEHCPVYLKNQMGKATVNNLSNQFRFRGEFTQIDLFNVQGMIDLKSRFGDIFGRQIGGIVNIYSRRSDINLAELNGSFNLEAYYGVLEIFASKELTDLGITANHSDVFLYNANPQAFGYSLTATNGKINLPNNLNVDLLENTADQKKMQFKPDHEYYPNITISISFGSLQVEKEKKKP